jgi:type I restriction enzyme S subunit
MNNTTIEIKQTTQLPTGFKQTSVGLIPKEWDVKKLGELGTTLSGLTYSPDDICEETGTLVLRSSNIKEGHLIFSDNVFVKVNEGDYNPVKENDILICVRNGSKSLIGKNALITKKAEGLAFGAFMAIFRSEYNKFLYHIFATDIYYKEIHKNLGATINSINGSDLKEIKIPIPPLPEQLKIAEILSTWDNAIDNCKKIIKKLKKRNKDLAQQLLTGKTRVKGFEGTKWENKRLKDISNRVTAKNKELNDTVVTISAQRGFVLQEDFFNKRVASDTLLNYYLLKKGQFAYNKSYSNGYPMGAFKRLDNFEKAVVTTLYICFELKKNVDSEFMNYFFENGMMVNNLMKVAQEGGRAHGLLNIGLDDFFNLKLTIPSKNEQEKIVSVLVNANEELKQYEQKLTNLQLQKKGLMQQLLTGKVRVKV